MYRPIPERRVDCLVALALAAIGCEGQGAIFFGHLDEPDPELPSVGVEPHPPEEFLDDFGLLPFEERERLACELALGVDEELLEEVHRVLGLLGVEVERLPLISRFAS